MRSWRVAVALTPLVLCAAGAWAQPRWGPTDPADPRLNQGPKAEAVGERGMVSTQLATSTLAALAVLEDGGNAVDAALTALFVQQVHDYHMVFLFGSMSALYYDAESGQVHALNAIGAHPDPERVASGDWQKVLVGGTVRGAAALHERFGSRPWASLVEPAVAAAEEGAIVTSFMYGLNFALFESGFLGDLRDNPEARAFYMPDGHLVGVGRRWKMPALAATLRAVADDPDYMYTGAWAEKFVDAANARGGGVTREDMAEYAVEWGEPVRFTYRGQEIVGSPPPDTGGLYVGLNLNVLENFDLARLGHYSESAATLEILARTFARAAEETSGGVRDPLSYRQPTSVWLDPSYGELVARYVRETMPLGDMPAPGGGDTAGARLARATTPPRAELGSDHIVVVDEQGNWISMLHTIHGGSPGVFVDGVRATGSGLPAPTRGPGRRLILPITGIMLMRDGAPWLAMGTPGNPPQPVTEVLLSILDYGMDPLAAADAPRFWASEQGHEIKLRSESRISEGALRAMGRRGIAVTDLGAYNYHTGSMQIVWRDADGRLHGVTDPRRLGHAAGR